MNGQFDLIHIFWGDTTWIIVLEIVFRTTVLFLFSLFMIRMVGHRGISQLSLTEFVLIIALGSAVGDPMFYLDIPLIHGMIVITLVVGYQVLLTTITMRSKRAAKLEEGAAIRLVVDGMIDLDGVRRARLTHEEVFAELRQWSVCELGEVQCAYLEIDGKVSIFKYVPEAIHLGLSLIPEFHQTAAVIPSGEKIGIADNYACINCGYTTPMNADAALPDCPRCCRKHWIIAVDTHTAFSRNRSGETS